MGLNTMKFVKIIAAIILTILVGAMSNGVWELLLSPVLEATYRWIVGLVSSIYGGYLDSIYESATKDIPDIYQKKIVLLIYIVLGNYLIFVSLKYGNWRSPFFSRLSTAVSNRLHVHGLIIGCWLLVFSFFGLSKTDYSQEIKYYSFHSMEILRPYIGENKYLSLKSSYYQIASSTQFQAFNKKLVEAAKKSKVILPKVSLIE